jgi:hypothetical protein
MTRSAAPLVVGVVGVLGAGLGWLLEPARFAHAWLGAFSAWLEWPLGSLALLMVHALTGGRWGEAIRPALLCGIATLPLVVPGLLPLAATFHVLYPWARPDADVANAFYLNVPFFAGRFVVYLIVWFGLSALVFGAVRHGRAVARFAAPGLLLLAVTATFAAIDTTLSLSPDFNSSEWGMIAAAGAGLLALSVATLMTAPMADSVVVADLGRLLLGLVVLWAYLDFMQFLIVWESDLAPGAAWYVQRSSHGWGLVVILIGLGHFLLPMAMLILPAVRRSRRAIMLVAAWLVLMEIVHAEWLVLPAVGGGLSWIDLFPLLAFGGFGVALAQRTPQRVPAHV